MTDQQVGIILVEENEKEEILALRFFSQTKFGNNVQILRNGEQACKTILDTIEKGIDCSSTDWILLLSTRIQNPGATEVLKKLALNNKPDCLHVILLSDTENDPEVDKCSQIVPVSRILRPLNLKKFTNAISGLGFSWIIVNKPVDANLK